MNRDIALVCREEVTVGALTACIRRAGGKLLRDTALLADDRSIVAAEADDEIKAILEALEKELGAVLR